MNNIADDLAIAYRDGVKDGKPKWIPVTEKLPQQNEDVLICYEWVGESGTKYKEMDIMTLKEADYRGHKIIAWMPLPEPPKDGET